MASGRVVYAGAAACGSAFPLGTRFRIYGDPTGRTYICEDTGLGPPLWVDVFFWDEQEGWAWQVEVGSYGTIILLH